MGEAMAALSSIRAPDDRLFQTDFPPEEFRERRGRIFDTIAPKAHALLQGAPPVRGFRIFRQTNDFYYCSGVEAPQACLLLRGADRTTRLYLPHRPEGQSAEGARLSAEDADLIEKLAGVDGVHGIESLSGHLQDAAVVYTPHMPAEVEQGSRDELLRANQLVAADPWDARPAREQHLIGLLRSRFPAIEIRDLSPVLDALRAVKSPGEIELLRSAGRLSALAVIEAMRATRPGMFEYQLGALANCIYLAHGARGEGYRSIIASGGNAWYGHYFRNDSVMADGDLVLMDTAPDFRYYTSDIGRMWPVNGVYALSQRELYGFMVQYHKALLRRIRLGVTADQIMDEAAAEMEKVVNGTPFSKPIYQQAAQRALKFRGHLSHPVGMAVHDVGRYNPGALQPGAVFAVDPQMRVPEEMLYIRVEDTVVVTDEGIENLTRSAPLELDDVEAIMREGRKGKEMV
jgi:Xaa-Pro aminopeptidase